MQFGTGSPRVKWICTAHAPTRACASAFGIRAPPKLASANLTGTDEVRLTIAFGSGEKKPRNLYATAYGQLSVVEFPALSIPVIGAVLRPAEEVLLAAAEMP